MAQIIRKFDVSVPKLDVLGRAFAAEPLNWKISKTAPESRSCSVTPRAAKSSRKLPASGSSAATRQRQK